jgi:ATP-dependent RNA helicase DDX47/RRP3
MEKGNIAKRKFENKIKGDQKKDSQKLIKKEVSNLSQEKAATEDDDIKFNQIVNEDSSSDEEIKKPNQETSEDLREDQLNSGLYDTSVTFKSIGVCEELCEILEKIGYKYPSKIQKETLPYALAGRDIIGLAETGSGKTAAFGIPIIQKLLLEEPRPFYACILSPTRELSLQINQHLEVLGSAIGLKTCVLVGGLDSISQAIALSKNPHIIIGTPGRVIDHLSNTKGFNLKHLKFLVFDEADRLLDLDFEKEIHQLLNSVPKQRTTLLFSATMTSKVHKLQKASLIDPVKIEINSKYTTVSTLVQNYMFIPIKYKETYLSFILSQHAGNTVIIFVSTCLSSIQ